MTELEPLIADEAPEAGTLTDYDDARLIVYLRLLDAEAEGADWRDVARIVLLRDPDVAPEASRRCWESHLRRAQWIARTRYEQLYGASR